MKKAYPNDHAEPARSFYHQDANGNWTDDYGSPVKPIGSVTVAILIHKTEAVFAEDQTPGQQIDAIVNDMTARGSLHEIRLRFDQE